MNKSQPSPPVNYYFALMTLLGLLVGGGLTFIFSESFIVSLPQNSLIAIICSLLWAGAYSLKNYQKSVFNLKEILGVIAVLLLVGIISYSQFSAGNSFSFSSCVIWSVTFAFVYMVTGTVHVCDEKSFVFHNGSEQRIAFHDLPKKRISKDHFAFHIDNDGLDPQVIFNVEITGAKYLIQVKQIGNAEQFERYLLENDVTVKQLGNAIAGVALMEMQYKEGKAYYQIVADHLNSSPSEILSSIDIALLDNSDDLNLQVEQVLLQMFAESKPHQVEKINIENYQAMFKFHAFVEKLKRRENRSIDYLSFYHGKFEISNSEYVELYNCNLHTSLISWINQDGLIRTDYVDEEEKVLTASERKSLQTIIGLPFTSSRLLNIQIIRASAGTPDIQLYLTFAELSDDEPTGKESSLSLSVKGKDLILSSEPLDAGELLSIGEYFNSKIQVPFY
jgi:hypothetical protein